MLDALFLALLPALLIPNSKDSPQPDRRWLSGGLQFRITTFSPNSANPV
jgi:hypothetical protein